MSTLERIQLSGYKSIRKMDLELTSLNILIGPNGAGKSNLISVFELFNEIIKQRLGRYVLTAGGADTFLYFGRKNTAKIGIELSFEGKGKHLSNGYDCTLVPTQEDTLVFGEESCWVHDKNGYSKPYAVHLGSGHAQTALMDKPRRTARYVLNAMRSWRVYHFHDTSKTSQIKATGDINDNVELHADAANLAAFLYFLQQKQPDTYKKIIATVQLAAPFFADFDLKPSRLNEEKIRLEWHERESDTYFNAHALSDGTLRFICLATLLLMPDPPSTIIIDEPELGLHPYAITLLAALLRSAATRTQIIVSTQSVTLVNQFALEEIIVVNRKDGQSIFERPDAVALESWLEEYGMGDLWEKNLLGGRPR
ncbi:MAG: AAA family ATPase [Anaerolineae bacterium]|nr:AAA family ATPase [Anaerolineae bacterium]